MWVEFFKNFFSQISIAFGLAILATGFFILLPTFFFIAKEKNGCLTFAWQFFTVIYLAIYFGVEFFILPHDGKLMYYALLPNVGYYTNSVNVMRTSLLVGNIFLAILLPVSLLTLIVRVIRANR